MITGRVQKHQSNMWFSWKFAVKVILYFLLLITATFAINKFKQAQYFPIKNVQIFGVKHVNQQQVQTFLKPLVSRGFFGVEIDVIKERMLQIPWVAETVVHRIWPDKIAITVTEKIPLASWNGVSLLSTTGQLFNPPITDYLADLPTFLGPEGQQIIMAQYYAKINNLIMPLHFKISRLELSPTMSWNIVLDNGIKLSVGHKDILTRLSHFVKVYSKIVGDREAQVEYIDLRYPNGIAVRWRTIT